MRGVTNGDIRTGYIYICNTLVQAIGLEYLFFVYLKTDSTKFNKKLKEEDYFKHGCFIFNALLQKKIEKIEKNV